MEQKLRRDCNMGKNLKILREQYGISQEKLCIELQRRDCDIGRTTYAKYESCELNIRISVIVPSGTVKSRLHTARNSLETKIRGGLRQ